MHARQHAMCQLASVSREHKAMSGPTTTTTTHLPRFLSHRAMLVPRALSTTASSRLVLAGTSPEDAQRKILLLTSDAWAQAAKHSAATLAPATHQAPCPVLVSSPWLISSLNAL